MAKVKRGPGPPLKEIDAEQVKRLAAINCSHAEIGAVLGCSADTLERRFRAEIDAGRAHMRVSLKRKQYEMAMGGNITMLIWLGKQYLDQSDKNDYRVDASLESRNGTAALEAFRKVVNDPSNERKG